MNLYGGRIFLTVGQAADLTFIDSDDIALNEQGQLKLSATFTETEAEGVFAAGDVALGPKLMIDAIASGKQAARKIYAYLKKKIIAPKTAESHEKISKYRREWGYETLPREGVPTLPPAERKKSVNRAVETGFSETQGLRQASRCLNCAVNTIFDSQKCILCGGCADVCPEHCLKLVSFDRLQGNDEVNLLIKRRVGDASSGGGGAIIKDESICIRCGLCAERCPAGAITMETFNFKEEWIYEG
jgi:ferredoxin